MLTERIRRLIARTLGPLVFMFTLGRVEVDMTGRAVSSARDDGPSIASLADPEARPADDPTPVRPVEPDAER